VQNRVTDILGTQYPLVQGAMRQITLGEMAAAVSNSGGFGQIASSMLPLGRLRAEIKRAQRLTDRPFGVNVPLHRPNAVESVEMAADLGIHAITTSGGNPVKIMDKAKRLGLKVLHKVSNTEMGLKAQTAGVDGVIATGYEAGGHGGKDHITTLCLVPQLVDMLNLPVIAAGGICDARGVAAAFALGAQGVEIGTRFIASTDCPGLDYYKKALLDARDTSTTYLGHGAMNLRVLKNQAVLRLMDPEEKTQHIRPVDYTSPQGDAETTLMPAGMNAGLIRKIMPIRDIVEELMLGCRKISLELEAIFMEKD
jgi:enoyl-[acyl-carrier protein] reductase II